MICLHILTDSFYSTWIKICTYCMMNTIHQRYDRENSTAGSYIQKFRFRCNILLELTNTQLCCLMHTRSKGCARIDMDDHFIPVFRLYFLPGRDDQNVVHIELFEILFP